MEGEGSRGNHSAVERHLGFWGATALGVGAIVGGGILALAYIPVLLLIRACQGRRGESWRLLLERIGRGIPLVGSTRRAWSGGGAG